MNEGDMSEVPAEIDEDEQRELDQRRAEAVKPIVRDFLDNFDDGLQRSVQYLRANPEHVSEFCLQMVEAYRETDRFTPALRLAEVIKELIK